MRTFVSAVAVLIGLLLAAVSIPALWVDRNIVQEDGFVALASPLGEDPEFQKRLATAAVGSLGEGAIPDGLKALVQPLLESAAQSLVGLPGYPDAWAETLRKSHRITFADPGASPADAAAAPLTLDLAPIVQLAAKQLTDATTFPIESPEQVPIEFGDPSQRQVTDRIAEYAPLGLPLAAAAGIALVLALLIARRRSGVLAVGGVGALLIAGGWKLALDAAGDAVIRTTTGDAVADTFRRGLVRVSTESFEPWILAVAVAGVVLLVLAVVARAVGGRRR